MRILRCFALTHLHSQKWLRSVPMPLISISTVLTGSSWTPRRSRSRSRSHYPAAASCPAKGRLTRSEAGNTISDRVALPLFTIEDGPHPQRFRPDSGRDYGPERPESVKTLGANPLREIRVLVEDIGGADVVDAGIPENAALSLRYGSLLQTRPITMPSSPSWTTLPALEAGRRTVAAGSVTQELAFRK